MEKPAQVRRAVIDVGTNSVKLLVADVTGEQVNPVLEDSHQTRLGAGLYKNGTIEADRIRETSVTVSEFARQARDLGSQKIRVLATSAAREAANGKDLLDAIQSQSGLRAEVISGEQEAKLAFRGATMLPEYACAPVLLQETGGGSTQFVLGTHEEFSVQGSFRLGTVRLLECCAPHDPPRESDLAACKEVADRVLREQIVPAVGPGLSRFRERHEQVIWLGAGGTASILGCMEARLTGFDRAKLEATRLSLERLRWHEQRLWSLPLEERKKTPGLPPKRADVILTGSLIYRAIAEQLGFEELRITTRGLRFAALADAK